MAIGEVVRSPLFLISFKSQLLLNKSHYILLFLLYQAYTVARKALKAPRRKSINNITDMTEALHSVGASASFVAYVVLVLNVKMKRGMFSDGRSSIEMSNKKQGAAFSLVLNKFVLKCCVKDGWRLHGVLEEADTSPVLADADAEDFQSAARIYRKSVRRNLRSITESKHGVTNSYNIILSKYFFDEEWSSDDDYDEDDDYDNDEVEEKEEEEDEDEEEDEEEHDDEEDDD